MKTPEAKPCAVCGRTIEWRKKWEKTWDEVKYCGEKCRRARSSLKTEGAALEARILELLRALPRGTTLDEEAVAAAGEANPPAPERVREAARRLVTKGEIEIIQNGKPVDPSTCKGPIRLRLRDRAGS